MGDCSPTQLGQCLINGTCLSSARLHEHAASRGARRDKDGNRVTGPGPGQISGPVQPLSLWRGHDGAMGTGETSREALTR
jgi:hypothetical protein